MDVFELLEPLCADTYKRYDDDPDKVCAYACVRMRACSYACVRVRAYACVRACAWVRYV